MKTLSVLNPAAGKGTAVLGRTGYITTGIGDCRRFVREECLASPCAHFDVYGGDGTLNEAINGIMDAGAGKTASVKMHPCGSGNDQDHRCESWKGKSGAFGSDPVERRLCGEYAEYRV